MLQRAYKYPLLHRFVMLWWRARISINHMRFTGRELVWASGILSLFIGSTVGYQQWSIISVNGGLHHWWSSHCLAPIDTCFALSSSSDGSGQRPRLLGDKNPPPATKQWAPGKDCFFFNGSMDVERPAAMAANCR